MKSDSNLSHQPSIKNKSVIDKWIKSFYFLAISIALLSLLHMQIW